MAIWQRFKTDQRGATAVMFGLALVPVMGLAGAAIDYGRATAARMHLQRAVDDAALLLVREASALKDAELKRQGTEVVKGLMGVARGVSLDRIEVSRDGRRIRVAAEGTVATTFMGVAGFASMKIASEAQSTWGMQKIELALVLDNTGSMNESPQGKRKIDELKAAAGRLLEDLRAVAQEPDTVKVSIVPFDTEVRLDTKYRNESWLRWENPADRLSWTGYVEDRDQPHDVTAAPATGDAATKHRARRVSRYPAGTGTGRGDIAAIRPLTSLYGYADYQALTDTVAAMRPRGNTNITLGVVWGLATLTKSDAFSEAEPVGTKGVKKFMIVLTDGENTQSLVNGAVNTKRSVIDARTRLACETAKGVVTVYTIRLVEGNADLLRNCASDPDKYYDVTDPSKLDGVFQAIIREISGTRLSV